MSGKRENYLSWDEYFMGLAKFASLRSKDPNTQVGACIVDNNHKIISLGYNGLPNGCSDDDFPWEREGDELDTKYYYVCHSELNAILNSRGTDLTDKIIYVTLFPCHECTKAIIQSGIKKLVYLDDKYHCTSSSIASRRMLKAASVEFKKYQSKNTSLNLNY